MPNMKEFWNYKAKKFPSYDENDKDDLKLINEIYQIIKKHHIDITNKEIIDIGCGSGRFTIFLAKYAKKVVGVDISEEMLKKLSETAKLYDVSNITTHNADWQTINIYDYNFYKSFDIAFASMMPGINSQDTLTKMINCAKSHCVLIAFGRKRENKLFEEIFKAHNSQFKIPFSALDVAKILDNLNIKYTLDFVENCWESTYNFDELIDDINWHLKINEVEPNISKIKDVILKLYGNQTEITCKSTVEMGVLTWNV